MGVWGEAVPPSPFVFDKGLVSTPRGLCAVGKDSLHFCRSLGAEWVAREALPELVLPEVTVHDCSGTAAAGSGAGVSFEGGSHGAAAASSSSRRPDDADAEPSRWCRGGSRARRRDCGRQPRRVSC